MADNQEKLQSTDIKLTSSNKILTWLSNFWYYHKWKVIIIAFFAIISFFLLSFASSLMLTSVNGIRFCDLLSRLIPLIDKL